MDFRKNYYGVLEIPVTASKEEIRAAYRRLAKLCHPDKNAGNTAAEEKFKLINEANEILSNPILRAEYDSYRIEQERWEKMQENKEAAKDEIKPSNKRSYTKTKTVVSETRIYIKGEITVKYWADCKDPAAAGYDTVLDYKINPTEVLVAISEENIFPAQDIPPDFLKAYKESDVFAVPVRQPIRCEIISQTAKDYFELTLRDLRIKSIKLEGVTKHENKSYGTLKGECYGYSTQFTYEEVSETVTECFGETGNVERKQEDGWNFIRKEYYYPDCSKYWGHWIKLYEARASEPGRRRPQSFRDNYSYINGSGCGLLVWVITSLFILFLSPKFFIVCIVLAGLGLLIRYGETIFSSAARFFSILGAGLLLLFIVTAVRSISNPGTTYIKKRDNAGSVETTRSVRRSPANRDSAATSSDTLITHFLKWEDYAGKVYAGNISISVAALRNSNTMHKKMSVNFYRDISEIYRSMADYDSSALHYLYETFDSIKAANNLNEVAFSQMLVSAIQSRPYYLVLDKSCDENYNDDFTRNYLANFKTDCCVGNEVFGVRSPVEFLSDLKGDCDTRALLLYQVLKHYNYNVALLTSTYYKHAMIAVNFAESTTGPGLSITIDDKRYYMWETTSSGVDYGEVASNFNNLSFWEISLLNKKIQYEIDLKHL